MKKARRGEPLPVRQTKRLTKYKLIVTYSDGSAQIFKGKILPGDEIHIESQPIGVSRQGFIPGPPRLKCSLSGDVVKFKKGKKR